MASNPDKLRKQAQSIASKSSEPKQAWKELREWASEKGPLAMEMAVHEFLANHGRNPEVAALMPGIMHRVSVLPLGEKNTLLSRRYEPEISPVLSMRARSNLSLSKERPTPIKPLDLSIAPADPVSMRDMPLRVHEGMKQSLRLPMKSDETKKRSETAARAMAAGKTGEEIVHSLIQHVSYHGTGGRPKRKSKARTKPSKKPASVRKKTRAKKVAPVRVKTRKKKATKTTAKRTKKKAPKKVKPVLARKKKKPSKPIRKIRAKVKAKPRTKAKQTRKKTKLRTKTTPRKTTKRSKTRKPVPRKKKRRPAPKKMLRKKTIRKKIQKRKKSRKR